MPVICPKDLSDSAEHGPEKNHRRSSKNTMKTAIRLVLVIFVLTNAVGTLVA
jgi:hypothetical protein